MDTPRQQNYRTAEPVKKPGWKMLNKISNHSEDIKNNTFMNYGYKTLSKDEEIDLLHDDEKNRPYIELYDRIISKVDLHHKDILEICSGRGGGASYINRYYSPKSYIGLETSKKLVSFCKSYYQEPGLSFLRGSKEDLPFDQERFDFVLNIGSSGTCHESNQYLNEIYRVLRKDAFLIYADTIEKRKLETVKHRLRMAGFTIEHKDDISKNIAAFIKNPDPQIHPFKKERIPGFMKKAFSPFMKTKDSEISESLLNGTCAYMVFILKKVT